MEWTSLNDLREKFLSFFESKDHTRLKSFALVPKNDNSLLLINSGMAPLKKYFTGELTMPNNRATSCQKCIRTPDIERVGKTARHGTYFEMLGNFSFGDYFKSEATAWAWEFLTKVLAIPVDKLWVSIYEEDDEAFEIWKNEVGVAPERIVRLGKEDNFWEHGTGPCGPCSEIYFDRGPAYGCKNPNCAVGCDCDRYVEVWNLVFTQFDSDGKGNYARLAKPNIDTGMGLERLACVMQGANNLFEVDTVRNIMNHASRIAGVEYGRDGKTDVSLRVITDHIRSTVFMIGDGVIPSNEGRGYVLRRLLRRAARHGKLLGIKDTFLYKLCETVIKENLSAYPELSEKQEYIKKVILNEEENFARTIDTGINLLENMTDEMKAAGKTVLSGENAFKLNDTFGFPLDLTKDILLEQGLSVDEDGFAKLMKEQRQRARSARSADEAEAWKSGETVLDGVEPTVFIGYSDLCCTSKIVSIISENEQSGNITQGARGILIAERTPFYAESGGQVGDTGIIICQNNEFTVEDTQKNHDGVYFHIGTVTKGEFAIGQEADFQVDVDRRRAIARNHSSLHLLQAALRQVLGTHVEQAGSYVNEYRGRLDFTHFSAMTPEEIKKVEHIVNEQIMNGLAVDVQIMSIEQARQTGAMALFGEKYGKSVRVVSMGTFSKELCGGTHIGNTGMMGLFKIVSEASVAAGVRRIECITGFNIISFIENSESTINEIAETVKSNPADVVKKTASLHNDYRQALKEIESLNSNLAMTKVEDIVKNAVTVGNVKVVASILKAASVESLRKIGDALKEKYENIVAVLAVVSEDKINFLCVCGKIAVSSGAHAGNIVKQLAELTGGNGGGRPDTALAGGKETDKLDGALKQLNAIVDAMLKR